MERSKGRQLIRLAQASARIHVARELDEVMALVAEEARGMIGAHQAVVSLTSREGSRQEVHSVSLSEKYARWRDYDEPPWGGGIYRLILKHGRPMRLTQEELERHPAWRGFGAAKDRHPPLRGWLSAPIKGRDGSVLGLIQLSDRMDDGDFDEDDELILTHFAGMAAVAIENSSLMARAQAAEARYGTILSGISDPFLAFDEEWRFSFVNEAAAAMLGRAVPELVGRVVWELYPELAEDALGQAYREAFGTGRLVTCRNRHEVLGRDFNVRIYPFDGGIAAYYHDVTDVVAAERRLKESQAALESALGAYRRTVEASPDVICVFDAEGRFREVSPRSLELWGYAPHEMIGRGFEDFVQEDDVTRTKAEWRAVASGRSTRNFENRWVHKSGATVPVLWSAVWSPEDRAVHAVARDLTERLRIERHLRESQRMEAVGQLTGGIAHDFNNLLTVILGNAELLMDRLSDDQRLRLIAEMMRKAAERGAALTGRLLAFSRRQTLDPRPVDVNRQVAEMDVLLRRTLGEDIDIEFVRGAGLWRAFIDPVQLETALLNLALNARDAMPGGGKLTMETGNAHIDLGYAENHEEVTPGQYVMLAVTDTGCGMPPEVAARAFEPFFTTKDVDQGSGLGLSMVYGFVKQSGGHVKIYSEVGQGTTVKLYLPRADADEESHRDARAADEKGGTESILLVEDDDLVRAHVEDQIRELGYRVVSAPNGPQALDLLERSADFDLLFTDIVMPGGMKGGELAKRARAMRPGLKVLFTSGYTENAIVHNGILDRGVRLLNKPFRLHELAAKLREALTDAPGCGSRGKDGDRGT